MRNFLPIRLLLFPVRKAVDALGQINVPARLMRRAFPNSRIVKSFAAVNSGVYRVLFGKEKNELRKAKWARIDARYHEGVAAREQRKVARLEGRQEGRREGRQEAAREVEAETAQDVPAPTQRTPASRAAIGAERVRPEPAQAPARGQAPALGVQTQRLPAQQTAGRTL